MLERVTVVILSVTLSVRVSLFDFGEGAIFRVETYINKCVHSNSPNPGALGPGTARNSEMSVSGNSQSSTSLYIVSYRHKLLLYMYMYTTIKNTSSVTILWKILCNFVA